MDDMDEIPNDEDEDEASDGESIDLQQMRRDAGASPIKHDDESVGAEPAFDNDSAVSEEEDCA